MLISGASSVQTGIMSGAYPSYYSVNIEHLPFIQEPKDTMFKVLASRVNGKTAEILVECYAQNNPGIQACFDEASDKLYLIGGNIDQIEPLELDEEIGCAVYEANSWKARQTWVHIDLSSLRKRGELTIFGSRTQQQYSNTQAMGINIPNTRRDIVLASIFLM